MAGMSTTYQVMFHTSLGAVLLRDWLKTQGVTFQMMDAPRHLSADCGLSIRVDWPQGAHKLINEHVSGLYRVEGDEYRHVWLGD